MKSISLRGAFHFTLYPFEDVNSSLISLLKSGEINEAQKGHLLDWTQRVFDKLTVNYKNVTKGVDDLMGGYILHTRTDDILDRGKVQRDREKIEVMLRKGLKPEEVANYGDYPLALVKEVESNMLSLA